MIHTKDLPIETGSSIHIPRLPWPRFFMLQAHLNATRSTCDRGPELIFDRGRKGVGATVVRENRIVSGGYSGSAPGEPHCNEFVCFGCDYTTSRKTFEEGESKTFRGWRMDEGVTLDEVEKLNAFFECPHCLGKLVGGHYMVDGHCVRTLHAEENAILQAALDGVSLRGTTVYTTASPCWDCAKRLARVGVAKVVFGSKYESRYGLSTKAVETLGKAGVEVSELIIDLALFLSPGDSR